MRQTPKVGIVVMFVAFPVKKLVYPCANKNIGNSKKSNFSRIFFLKITEIRTSDKNCT
jgi:hypothetical protein